MAALRVVHVLEAIGGGTKKHVTLLADGLKRRKVDVSLVLPLPRPYDPDFPLMDYAYPDAMRARGFAVQQFAFVHGRITPLRDLIGLLQLVRYFRKERFAVVHTHSAKAGVLGRAAAWLAGIPVTVHTPYSLPFRRETRQGAKYWLYYALEWTLAKTTDLMVATSQSEFEAIEISGIVDRAKLTIIANSFDLENYPWPPPDRRAAKNLLALDPEHPVVGTVARLAPQKGVMMLVEASAAILRRFPNTQFVVVGDGDQRAEIVARVHSLGLAKNWQMVGARTDYKSFVQAFDVFAFPSLWEGLPYAPIEAMALGTPVVATAAVGVRDLIVDNQNGILVPVGDADGFAGSVIRVLGDPDLACRLALQGRRFVEDRFADDAPVEATLAAYRVLVQRRGLLQSDGR